MLMLCRCAFSQGSTVLPNGNSTLSATFGSERVRVQFHTSTVDAISPASANRKFAQCTYSRSPCSLTGSIEIFWGAYEVFIPRSAYADLGDISTAHLTMSGNVIVLTIQGGDASESYIAKLRFNKQRVLSRQIYSSDDLIHPLEVSQYYITTTN